MTRFEFEAIGTSWQIDIQKELTSNEEALLLNEIKERIDIFDKNYSRFRSDSLVTQMSKVSGTYEMPNDAGNMIGLYEKVYKLTNGLVTPLIGEVLVQAGYDADYSLVKKEMTASELWEQVIMWNDPVLNLKKPALLDFGACGKGYLVDIVSEILEKKDIFSYCVDAGGDMRYRNELLVPLKIGLENPDDFESVIGVVLLTNKSLCGSAGNRRKWADMHHIINPKTLVSPLEIKSVWVIAENTIISDILTTALFFTSPETLEEHFSFDYFILYQDFNYRKSEGFTAELFLK